ncbi:Triacylglycerol lipase [Tolypocladium paradoxum]|uniref:Triacylglycerol lipase n=1 Tax=Tolypocladium paradoxum TaxID=94208 RepID=A0A2S4KZN1_9HYPO|nr:Triacylglycerol lipase [Tolypocladium paradoxum]
MRCTSLAIALGAVRLTAALNIDTRQAIEPISADEFKLFAVYSMAAYCKRRSPDARLNKAVCTTSSGGDCLNFDNATIVQEFVNDDYFRIGGYVARNPSKKHIVVAFKGTDSYVDLKTDSYKFQIDSDICNGCKLHGGFGTAFDLVKDQVEDAVRAEKATPGQENYRVVVTGHSLGGAVATVAGAYLRKQGIPCDLYTYGSPRVGNDKFALFASSQAGFSARITNRNDGVTVLPMIGHVWQQYKHTFPEYWYENGLLGKGNRYESPYKVCNGEDESCTSASCFGIRNTFWPKKWCSIHDHSLYISSLKPCGGRVGWVLGQSIGIGQLQAFFDNEEGDQSAA